MTHNFDEHISRLGSHSYKWDGAEEEDILPMWVADMDFRTAPAVVEALQRRVAHGIFGYTRVPQAYYDAVMSWFAQRHQWQIDKAININEVCDVNPFGVEALIAAYNEGGEWLDELRHYLSVNYNYLKAYFEQYLPYLPVTKLEGTYLVWVDCRALRSSSKEIEQLLIEKGKIWVNAGELYGEAGEGFIRINIACPRQVLIEGLGRLRRALL